MDKLCQLISGKYMLIKYLITKNNLPKDKFQNESLKGEHQSLYGAYG